MARLSFAVLFVVLPAWAEERAFTVSIDGHSAGELVIAFEKRADGATAVTVRSKYRLGGPTPLAFDYRGTESWKDGRLVRLEGLGSADGGKGGIALVAGKDAYSLKAGVKEVRVRDDVWPTLVGMLPDPDHKPLVVDIITGDVRRAKVETVGPDRVAVGGQPLAVTRYRVVAGSSRWDVSYDEGKRLAKWSWTHDGRTVVAELKHVKGD